MSDSRRAPDSPDGPDAIERGLAQLGAEHEPPAGWEAQVWGRIANARLDARIEHGLSELGAAHEPPAGWEDRVLQAIQPAAPGPRPRRWWWWLGLPSIPALATAAWLLWLRVPGLALELTQVAAGDVVRSSGDDVVAGTTLRARATGGAAYRAVWIYRNRRDLMVACPGSAGCARDGSEVEAVAKLALPGSYQVVALSSARPIAPPSPADLGTALAAAIEAGAEYQQRNLAVR